MSTYQPNRRLNFLPYRQPSAISVYTKSDQTTLITPSHTHRNVLFDDGIMTIRLHQHPIMPSLSNVRGNTPTGFVFGTPCSHGFNIVSPTPVRIAAAAPAPVRVAAAPVRVAAAPVAASWDSAGVIVIDNEYHDKSGSSYQCIFVGLNSKSGKHELFYGKRAPHDAFPIETARRECSEETSNMFRFSSSVFTEKFSVESPNKKHHAYVVRVQPPKHGIQSTIFYQNLITLKTARAPHDWVEMSDLTRIGIKEAISSGLLTHPNRSDFSMFDVYGNSITIFSRDAEFIRDAVKAKMNVFAPVNKLHFISSYDNKFDGNNNRFLNTTGCYTV